MRSPEPQYTNTYYVSPAGNDTNPGTFDLPLRTIQAGVDRAYAGERVFVLAGTYKEQVTFPRSGTSGAPITISGEVDGAGNPLALIDNTEAVGATWSPAPDVGAGVYKRVGFAPKLMLWNGEHILGINAKHMAGDSDQYCDKGFNILNYPPDKVWHPGGSASCSTAFWDDVMVLYGTLGETTFVRFRDYDDPNGQDLRAAPANTVCLTLRGNSYITVEHLILQGAVTSVVFDGSDHNIFRHNVVRHGNQRMTLSGSSGNLIEHNYFSLGYGEYGCFGEWGAPYTGILARRYAAYALGKWLAGNGSSLDRGVVLSGKNEFANNTVRQGDIGIYGGSSCEIHDNIISEFSSVGFYIGPNVRDIRIHDNRIYHCNGGIRFGSIGASYDSVRSGYIYRNRCYNDSGVGQFIITHTAGSNFTKAPDFWFYHNSVAGGNAWGQALYGACGRMKVVNNVMSSVNLMTGAAAIDDTTPTVWAAFDYNFMGGKYRGYRYFNWAATDSHNLWAADTMKGDVNHQVWSLGTEPDWIVPETSAAFCSGLDLSDSFTIRGVTYGPLPGMAKGYFTGSAPNLGAGQNTYQVEIPQGDPGPGGDTRPLELAFVPNPVTGRGVTVQCALPAGKVGELTMRDVVGRCVKSFALDPSGQTRLDLRGFAPGIYVAVLDAAGPSISRKLIVARRD
ncbi:hypothetical protein JXD38_10375 [candidate division WOR-3 bacterium]|nr:hypothetical protein [candidate division WOR-3 bacterium]